MKFRKTAFPGCIAIEPTMYEDHRGSFVKTFQASLSAGQGLACDFVEEYYSTSQKNVLRGMHFQLPPFAHAKMVYCVHGRVLDVIVDIRRDSPAYGQHATFSLDSKKPLALYIPVGFAHGFYTQSELAIMVYKTTSEYNPESDAGLRWDSIGFSWPETDPILSDRDRLLPALDVFDSPFSLTS
jgi:dTDP-4-dehydrorhamnose 3,5-epimerase